MPYKHRKMNKIKQDFLDVKIIGPLYSVHQYTNYTRKVKFIERCVANLNFHKCSCPEPKPKLQRYEL